MSTTMNKHIDSAETYHIVLPVRPALARKFDEEIGGKPSMALACIIPPCLADS